MAQVNVTISGRVYRMACEDGQEAHLHGLADRLDRTITHLKETFGEIGEQRLIVMAAIMAMDEAGEAKRKVAGLEGEIERLRQSVGDGEARRAEVDRAVADKLDLAAKRIETIAATLVSGRPSN
ncbi:cell division protein ZapA [Prosthecomicrobium sp. N25]|uniref:cell division protein ZapA n=1 Tax=Prosthecomicrobium sp. N25 TaxID=3129254 RepID=UPI00307800D8